MSAWNFADIWETVADCLPDGNALIHGDRHLTWSQVDAHANGFASTLLDLGVERQATVAQYLYNCPEYLESVFGTFKAGLVPINTNYRYSAGELEYLWDNSDTVAMIFHAGFLDKIEPLRPKLGRIRHWICVEDDSGNACPDWAISYADAAAAGKAGQNVAAPWGRSPDDLYMLYTGGTTGMPKGVMWRQDDLVGVLNSSSFIRYPEDGTVEDVRKVVTAVGPVHLSACPLMHGTGAFTAFNSWSTGGPVVTLTSKNFDPAELLDTVEREKVNVIAFVGDAFAKPILRALDAEPKRWDVTSLKILISSGVMWSEQSKQGLLKHNPMMLLVDAMSSSEALGMGQSISSAGGQAHTATFSLGERAKVISDDGTLIEPGSGEIGRLAVQGRTPVGYYKDPEKSARTFPVIDGVRYSMPGDYASVDADGTVHLLGRGSQCINTGGEKVYPEEVEEILKLDPTIRDAAVVGVPSEKFGEAIWAVLEPTPGSTPVLEDVIALVKDNLAAYKAPKGIVIAESIGRSPAGKVDYKRLKEDAGAAASAAGQE